MRAFSRPRRRQVQAGSVLLIALSVLLPASALAADPSPSPSAGASAGATTINCDSDCMGSGSWSAMPTGIDTKAVLGIGTIVQVAPDGKTVMVDFGGRQIPVGASWEGLPRLSESFFADGQINAGDGTRPGEKVLVSGGTPPGPGGTSWPGASVHVNWWEGSDVVMGETGDVFDEPALMVLGTLIDAEPDHITVQVGSDVITMSAYTHLSATQVLMDGWPLYLRTTFGAPDYQAELLTLNTRVWVYADQDYDWALNPESYTESQPDDARCKWADGSACHWRASRIYPALPVGRNDVSKSQWWAAKPYSWTRSMLLGFSSEVVGNVLESSAAHVLIQSYDRIVDCIPQYPTHLPQVGSRVIADASDKIDSSNQLKACDFAYPSDPAAVFPGGQPSGSPSQHVLSVSLGRGSDWAYCSGTSGDHSANELPAVESRSADSQSWCAPVASFPLTFTIDGSTKAPAGVTLALQLDPDDPANAPQYLEPLATDGTISGTISRVVAKGDDLPAWMVRILKRPVTDLERHVRVLAVFDDGAFAQADLTVLLDKGVPPPPSFGGDSDLVMSVGLGTIGQADGLAITNGSQQVDYNLNPSGLATGNFNYGQYVIVDNGTPTIADAMTLPSLILAETKTNLSWTYLYDRPILEPNEQWWGTKFMFGQFLFDWLTGGLYSAAQDKLQSFGVELNPDIGVHFQLRDQDPLSNAQRGWGVGFDLELSAGVSLSLFPQPDVPKSVTLLSSVSAIPGTSCDPTQLDANVLALKPIHTSGCLAQLTPTALANTLLSVAQHQTWIIPGPKFLALWLVTKDPANAALYMDVLGPYL